MEMVLPWPESVDLPWHESVKARLRKAIDSDRPTPHAILVSGFPGWGEMNLCAWLALTLLGVSTDHKESLCAWLAQTLLGEPTDPEVGETAHHDYHWVVPGKITTKDKRSEVAGETSTKDKRSEVAGETSTKRKQNGKPQDRLIKIEQIRELVSFAQGTRQTAPVKVAVVGQAHAMNLNAANALLKTLEEPPEATHIILGTDSAGALLPTVRSRCQAFTIPRDARAAADWLDSKGDQGAKALMEDYDGAPLSAYAGAQQGERPMVDILADLAAGRSVVDELLKLNPGRLSARWARRIVRILAGEAGAPAPAGLQARRVFGFLDELLAFHDQVARTNSVNIKLQLERLCHIWQSRVSFQ